MKTGKKDILGVLELGKVVKEISYKFEVLERKEKEEGAKTRKEGKGWQGGKDSKYGWRKRRKVNGNEKVWDLGGGGKGSKK